MLLRIFAATILLLYLLYIYIYIKDVGTLVIYQQQHGRKSRDSNNRERL